MINNDLSALFPKAGVVEKVAPRKNPKRKRAAKGSAKMVAVLDYETDPFKFERIPKPFCCEFHCEENGVTEWFWGDDCTEQFIEWVEKQEQEYLIYAHNGGKFDFHFLFKYISDPCLIIKTRIVETQLFQHTLRDSYAILPVPLRDYSKMEFDYDKMERPNREANKAAILEYLHDDCVQLYALVKAFVDRFGPRMTIGGTAMADLMERHPYQKQGPEHDAIFRPYFMGGRVEAFRGGVLPGPWKLYDINSAYAKAMRDKKHPRNGRFMVTSKMPDSFEAPFFMEFTGTNRRALPSVDEFGGLTFRMEHGRFYAVSHEIEAALEYGLIDIEKIHKCYVSTDYSSFEDFIDFWSGEKIRCKEAKDPIGYLFAKFMLNSAYGRFGINPANFMDWVLHHDFGEDEELKEMGYTMQCEYPDIELWARKAEIKKDAYCDVATAASITSACRTQMLHGMQAAIDPIYCDTDSLICREFKGDVHPTRLGAWDLEKEAQTVAIGGKKLFVMYDDPQAEKPIKLSSKGGTLSQQEIIRVCEGQSVHFENMAPTFSLKKKPVFITRTFRNTVAA